MPETEGPSNDHYSEVDTPVLPCVTKSSSGRVVKPRILWSPTSKPGPSAIHVDNSQSDHSDEDDDDDESDPCCVCQQSSPPNLHNSTALVIVNWAKCSIRQCNHWVHLRFCHDKTTVARNEKFLCPCCENTLSEP